MPNNRESRPTFRTSELKRIEAPGFVSIYANNADASMNFYDLCLVFGQVLVKPGTDRPIIEDRASVTMTWEHVEPLVNLLRRLLDDYERIEGKPRVKRKTLKQ